jgi:SAM-dependent methyltransferase
VTDSPVPDFSVPNAARMYCYYLGGKDHLPADREAAEKVIAAYPQTRQLARANRRFLTRAVWFAAEHGVRQFIELGAGMPYSPNVHEVARQVRPDARVAYVDNDPVVLTHHRAMWHNDTAVSVVGADIRYPEHVLSDPVLARVIDLGEPVAVLCVAVLHFIRDQDYPHDVIAVFRRSMAPGSYLVLSHAASDGANRGALDEIGGTYQDATLPAVPRSAAEIARFFTGLDLIEPGIVDVSQWRPDVRARPTKIRILGGAGRKP